MARIAGIDLPKNKRGVIGLTYIYGIGRSTSAQILKSSGIDENIKVQDWNDDQLGAIRNSLNEIKVEGALRSEVQLHIPLRGQHTKNNSRTRKGKRKTVANKKKATK